MFANDTSEYLKEHQKTTALAAFESLQQKRSTLTISYFIKNYLLLMNSINASLGPTKLQFKKSRDLKATFALGYYEDIYTGTIFYLEGNKGSKYMTVIELEKDNNRYDLHDIVVRKDNAKKIEAAKFFEWLKTTIQELSIQCESSINP